MDSELTFRGSSAEECEDFIRAVKRQGRVDGKLRDDKYMADLASEPFAGPALRWYTRLDRDIRDSWDKLQVALLDNYTDSEDLPLTRSLSISESVIPTPAAAVPTPSTQVALAHQRSTSINVPGRLRIIAENSSAAKYVSAKPEVGLGICLLCDDPSEAMIVQSAPGRPTSTNLRSFSVMNPAERSLPGLGIILEEATAKYAASKRCTQMVWTSVNEKKVRTSHAHQGKATVKSLVWDWSFHNGDVRAVWDTEDGAYLLVTVINVKNRRIFFVHNFDRFCADNRTMTYARAQMIFQPI